MRKRNYDSIRYLTETEKKQLWEEVRREFPDDKMMQEIHYVRLLHHFQTKDMPSQERIKYFELEKKKHA